MRYITRTIINSETPIACQGADGAIVDFPVIHTEGCNCSYEPLADRIGKSGWRDREIAYMIKNGWQVSFNEELKHIRWRSPCGISQDDWVSDRIDQPPTACVQMAMKEGHIPNAG